VSDGKRREGEIKERAERKVMSGGGKYRRQKGYERARMLIPGFGGQISCAWPWDHPSLALNALTLE